MKHLTSLMAAVLLAASTVTFAQTQVSYSTGNMGRNTVFRIGTTTKQGLAIKLSHEKLQLLKGHTVSKLQMAFGSRNTTGKKAEVFLATTLSGVPLQTQTIDIASANKWQDISLNAPYTITGDEEALYVGYTADIPETYNLLQSDFASDLHDCSFAWNNGEWSDLYGTGFGSANIRVGFSDSFTVEDIILKDISFENQYHKVGGAYNYSCELFNFGTEPLHTLTLSMQTGDEQQSFTIEGLNIAQSELYVLQLPTLTATSEGDKTVNVKVETVNGKQLACTSDDAFESAAFFYPEHMERNILVEEFTGMTCPNCPSGQRTLQTGIEQSQLPCIEILHHSGYSADFYSTDADWDYTMYYGSASTYAPAAMVNRLTIPAISAVPVFQINGALADILEALESAAQRQPYVSLGLSSNYDEASREVEVSLDIFCHNDLPGATVFNAFLVQDSIIGYQSNGGTDYAHNRMMRKVLTGNSWGMLLPDDYQRNDQQTWTTSFTLPDAIYSDFWTPNLLQQAGYTEDVVTVPSDPSHMSIIAYVANYDASNINNNMVYNCIEVPLMNGNYYQNGHQFNALEQIQAACPADAHSYDLSGRRIEADGQLPAGLYIIHGKKTLICK